MASKFALIVIFIFSFTSNALSYDGRPQEQVNSFFKDLNKGNSNEAIDNLYSSNPTIAQKIQQLTMLKQQVAMVSTLYGKSIGQENVIVEEISPSVMRIVTVDKHELHPVIWEFYFYKAKNIWIVSQSVFNDQFKFLDKKK